jgi:alkylation response protein AidB-like acyl-CoA dehydrogenase
MPQIILDDDDKMLEMLRDSVATLAGRRDGAKALRARRASKGDLDPALWQAMAEAGWLALLLPEELGGSGLGARELVILCEGVGRALWTEPLAQLAIFNGTLLASLPASDGVQEIATGIADGSRIVPVLWQDVRGKRAALTAETSSKGVTLTGRAELVTAAASATGFLGIADEAGVPVLLDVPGSTKGLIRSQRPSIDGSMLGAIEFDRCRLDGSSVLARGANVEAALEKAIEMTRLALAAELAGVGSRALELTVDYTKGRVQFGKPIASFQVIQHRLVDMWGEAEFACCAVANAANRLSCPAGQRCLAGRAGCQGARR